MTLHRTILAILIAALAGCRAQPAAVGTHDRPTPRARGPVVQSRAPRDVPLTPDTVDDFLAWAGSMPQAERSEVQRRIAIVAGNDRVVEALVERLGVRPIRDPGRHLMLLATLGEMRNARAVPALGQFVWDERAMLEGPTDVGVASSFDVGTTLYDYKPVLQARAAEMLDYIGTADAHAETLGIVARHPSKSVRLAAIDAYLYNHGDGVEALRALRDVVQADDAPYVGMPRRSATGDPAEFDARVDAFYARFPSERPPRPSRSWTCASAAPAPTPRDAARR